MKNRIILHVAGMFVLGAIGLVLVGAVYEWRMRRDVPVPTLTPGVGTTGSIGDTGSVTPPYSPVLAGIYSRLEQFTGSIDHDRSTAMTALDAARRLARALATSGTGAEFEPMVVAIEQARTAVQNGSTYRAVVFARRAAALAGPVALPLHHPGGLSPYVGATVVSTDGSVEGRVTAVSGQTIQVDAGVVRFMGVLPLSHAAQRTIPASGLIFGAVRPGAEAVIIDTTRAGAHGA